jgi:glutaminase
MSVNFGGATSGADEDAAEGDDGLVVGVPGKFGVSGAGEVGRVPPSVADGAWARALP